MDLRTYIRDIPDFPKEGIVYKDITPLLAAPKAFAYCIEALRRKAEVLQPECISAPEARGFIFGSALAHVMQLPFIPMRKPGKLPFDTHKHAYDLEYGKDALEVHVDAFQKGDKVLLIDDVLATGGTMRACCELAAIMGAEVVGAAFLMELVFLEGRELLADTEVVSLIEVT